MAAKTTFKIHTVDDSGKSKTLTENHPKLTASKEDFESARSALIGAYDIYANEIGVMSETTVFTHPAP